MPSKLVIAPFLFENKLWLFSSTMNSHFNVILLRNPVLKCYGVFWLLALSRLLYKRLTANSHRHQHVERWSCGFPVHHLRLCCYWSNQKKPRYKNQTFTWGGLFRFPLFCFMVRRSPTTSSGYYYIMLQDIPIYRNVLGSNLFSIAFLLKNRP